MFEAVLEWVKHDREHRMEHLADLIHQVGGPEGWSLLASRHGWTSSGRSVVLRVCLCWLVCVDGQVGGPRGFLCWLACVDGQVG